MREAFIQTLFEEASRNPSLCVLTADLGYTVFEKFQSEFPDRFLNVGVAEANLMGCAAGLAWGGMTPLVYSIANFSVLRPFEQIRNDICFPNRNVKIVGVGAGLAYGPAGFTHHATEDIALMRTLPNMVILCPSGPQETRECTQAMLAHKGPVYLRLSKKGEPDLFESRDGFQIGKARVLREGPDLTFFTCGILLQNVLQCVDLLSKNHRLEASVVHLPTVKPIDKNTLLRFARRTRLLISVEEHATVGGLGSAIAEVLASEADLGATFLRCGVLDPFGARAGDREYLLERSGLLPKQLEEQILQSLPALKR